MVDNREIDRRTDKITQEVIAIRRAIHENPELGFEEHETAARVAKLLTEQGIPFQTGIGGTGVVGMIEGVAPRPHRGHPRRYGRFADGRGKWRAVCVEYAR